MACTGCERRRKRLQALKDKKAAKGKKVQVAALGAVIAVSEAAGKAFGIHGEDENERETGQGDRGPQSSDGGA